MRRGIRRMFFFFLRSQSRYRINASRIGKIEKRFRSLIIATQKSYQASSKRPKRYDFFLYLFDSGWLWCCRLDGSSPALHCWQTFCTFEYFMVLILKFTSSPQFLSITFFWYRLFCIESICAAVRRWARDMRVRAIKQRSENANLFI